MIMDGYPSNEQFIVHHTHHLASELRLSSSFSSLVVRKSTASDEKLDESLGSRLHTAHDSKWPIQQFKPCHTYHWRFNGLPNITCTYSGIMSVYYYCIVLYLTTAGKTILNFHLFTLLL